MQINKDMEVVFETESGSRYEISKGKIRRLNPEFLKRGDGAWQKLLDMPYLAAGDSAVLTMESLHPLGPDDTSEENEEAAYTVRVTSPVVGLEIRNHNWF